MTRQKLLNRITDVVPSYAITPIVICIAYNMTGYFGIKLARGMMTLHDMSTSLDHSLPFVPFFIVFYIGAFLQWVIGFVICGREGRQFCYRMMSAELIAKTLTFITFLMYPTTMVRPAVSGTGLISFIVHVIYFFDSPINLFPSIHCMESWFCFRAALTQKKTGWSYKAAMGIMTLLVFSSVLLVKQHVIADVVGGVLYLEIGMFLTRRHTLEGFYRAIERKILHRLTTGARVNG